MVGFFFTLAKVRIRLLCVRILKAEFSRRIQFHLSEPSRRTVTAFGLLVRFYPLVHTFKAQMFQAESLLLALLHW